MTVKSELETCSREEFGKIEAEYRGQVKDSAKTKFQVLIGLAYAAVERALAAFPLLYGGFGTLHVLMMAGGAALYGTKIMKMAHNMGDAQRRDRVEAYRQRIRDIVKGRKARLDAQQARLAFMGVMADEVRDDERLRVADIVRRRRELPDNPLTTIVGRDDHGGLVWALVEKQNHANIRKMVGCVDKPGGPTALDEVESLETWFWYERWNELAAEAEKGVKHAHSWEDVVARVAADNVEQAGTKKSVYSLAENRVAADMSSRMLADGLCIGTTVRRARDGSFEWHVYDLETGLDLHREGGLTFVDAMEFEQVFWLTDAHLSANAFYDSSLQADRKRLDLKEMRRRRSGNASGVFLGEAAALRTRREASFGSRICESRGGYAVQLYDRTTCETFDYMRFGTYDEARSVEDALWSDAGRELRDEAERGLAPLRRLTFFKRRVAPKPSVLERVGR